MKIILIILSFFITFLTFSQTKIDIITRINSYKNNVLDSGKVDFINLKVKADDENYNCKVFYKKNQIIYIEGNGSDEFSDFRFQYLFENDSLIYSYDKICKMTQHWTQVEEGEDIGTEEKEGTYYYFKNKPIELLENVSQEENNEADEIEGDKLQVLQYNICQEKAYFLFKELTLQLKQLKKKKAIKE